MKMDWKTVIAIGVVGLIAAYLLKKQAVAAVTTAAQAINPVSPENIFYQGTSAVTSAITKPGEPTVPLGVQIYDWLHPTQTP